MSETEWVLRAALLARLRDSRLTARDALEIAEQLHDAWPALTPEEAVRAYMAPADEPCKASTALN